jgi:hypothetical protein
VPPIAAPGVADEIRPVDAEPVEDVDDRARAVVECERCAELFAAAMAGWVDEDHGAPIAEVFGLCCPHVPGHQQAWPEQHRFASAFDADPKPSEGGIEKALGHASTLRRTTNLTQT